MLTVLTGRSRRLWPRVLEEMGEAYAQGARRLFLITPDQYTLQAELELVERLNLPGLLDVEVLSPSRLLTRVFSLAGSPQRVRIDARGKAMMLADVLRLSGDDLTHFRGAADRRGFAERMARDIGEYKRAGRTPEDVLAEAEAAPSGSALEGKLRDIALIYARYEERLYGAFIDGEDAQAAMIERLPASGLLRGARVWVYGFDLITLQFLQQLVEMTRAADAVRLALTWERDTARDGLAFTPARDTLSRLSRAFDDAGMQWAQLHIDAPLACAPEIQHLERELFAVPLEPYDGSGGAVTLFVAANPYEEAMRTAETMLAFAREGMRFDEMAVVVGDVEAYAGAIETAFGRGGIPYHMTRSRPALAHPLLRTWVAALRCVTLGWRVEDAFDWLKGGFSGLTLEEAEKLENYAIEHGLRGNKWRRPIEDIALEALRAHFVTPLTTLQERLRAARDNTASLAAVYGLLEDVDAYGTLEAWQSTLSARGMLTEAAECAQAWQLALETLDQLHALLKGSRMPMAGLAQVIESGLKAAELGAVPASPGMAQVGQLDHVKLGGAYRVLFLLGMEDGIMRSEPSSLLTDAEAEQIAEATGQEQATSLRGDALAQLKQVNLLDTLSAPTERLFISHAVSGAGGEAKRPAAVLKLIRRVFPFLAEAGSAIASRSLVPAPGTALDAMGPMLRGALSRGGALEPFEAESAAWLLRNPDTQPQAEAVLRALEAPLPAELLGKRAADALYIHSRTSISRLETFASCAYRHFVQYGLRPVKRREFAVARDEMGTFYHRAMEGYAMAAAAHPGWPDISREDNDTLMDTILAPLKAEWADAPLGDNAMLRATGEAFCRVARRAAWTYAGQMRRGKFRTGVIEARFGPGESLPPIVLNLPDGTRRYVEGRIDRIDFLEDGGERWLRVVDYKSGGTTLDPSRVYSGLQLQLLLYLSAALAAHPGVEAGGAFYSRLHDPLVKTDSRDVAEIERLLAGELRLQGIALSDVKIIEAMEDGDKILTTKGEIRKDASVATAGELSALMRHAHTLSTSMAAQIAAGEIHARPAQLDAWRACSYCDFKGVCGFDPSLDGNELRRVERIGKDELLERVQNEEGL